jgi:hypothetical protein
MFFIALTGGEFDFLSLLSPVENLVSNIRSLKQYDMTLDLMLQLLLHGEQVHRSAIASKVCLDA